MRRHLIYLSLSILFLFCGLSTYGQNRERQAYLSTNPGMQFIQLLTDSGETKVYKVIVIK